MSLDTDTITYTREEILAHRREWLAALRSGDYTQASGVLYDGTGYCCLGVACKIGDVPYTAYSLYPNDHLRHGFGEERESFTLPPEGREWLGVDNANPSLDIPWEIRENVQDYDTGPIPGSVAELNDAGFTFNQIADLIEYFGFDPAEDLLAQEA